MTQVIEGVLSARKLKMAIVLSRFNDFIGQKLYEGALDCFVRHEGPRDNLTLLKVPGAFEIPLAAKMLAKTKAYDGIICLGAVIRGQTPHFDYVAAEVTKGIACTSLEEQIPIAMGVLTTDTIDQAVERAGTKSGNKGHEAMLAAIEMANALDKVVNLH